MTSTKLVKAEIERFLMSDEPEVLCVTGKWGVGKTYTWNTLLRAAAEKGALGSKKYSSISLFGINSLADLKFAIAENTQILASEVDESAAKEVAQNALLKSVKYLKGFVSAIPYVGKGLAESSALYFSALVNNQIVCVDDLDRKGASLRIEDVLGLISSLKEERRCKVVILLNEDELGDDRDTFDRYFEKVVDTRVVFAPTASEAVSIALTGNDLVSQYVRDNCIKLNISNIRVIKKIERLVRNVEPVLSSRTPKLLQQAAHTATLFGWSKFQPALAPSFDFYKTSSIERYLREKEGGSLTLEQASWASLLDQYQFTDVDDFDRVLLTFVQTGILDADAIRLEADKIEAGRKNSESFAKIEQGFRGFHDSFSGNAPEIAAQMREALESNYERVGLGMLDATMSLLTSIGRSKDAKLLLSFFEEKVIDEDYWIPLPGSFVQPANSDLKKVIERRLREAKGAPMDPIETLLAVSRSLNAEMIGKLARTLKADDVYRALKKREGKELRALIDAGLGFQRIGNATEDMKKIVTCTIEALVRIGKSSRLNAARVAKYGIHIDSTKDSEESA